MSTEDRKRIIDYIFNHPNTSEEIRRRFERWILSRETDVQIDEILQEIWERHTAPIQEEEDRRGLERLHATLRRRERWILPRRVWRYAGMVAAVVAVFVGGYYSSGWFSEPEARVTWVTSKENVGDFQLPDGTKVWLNGESQLTYNADFQGRTRDVSLSGEAFFEVRKDSLRPFRVHMGNLQVEVLGTSFDARSYQSGSREEIVLKSGSVKISGNSLRESVVLHPDERFTYDRNLKSSRIERVDARNYCQWFAPRLIFNNTPLRDVITNLERRYNVEISLSAYISSDVRLSLVVGREPLDDILDVMSSILSVRYRIDGSHVLIMKR